MSTPGTGFARGLPQRFSETTPSSRIWSIEYFKWRPAVTSLGMRQSMYQFGVRRSSRKPSIEASNLISPRQFVLGGGSRGDLAAAIQTLGSSAQMGQPVLPLSIRSRIVFDGGSGFVD